MSELLLKQILFGQYLNDLLDEAYFKLGLKITFGEAWRSAETCAMYAREGKGVPYSCHMLRLAVDLNVIKPDGTLANQKSDYQPLGDFWKQLPTLHPGDIEVVTCWGGDFTSLCDYYHFSIEHGGVK